MRLNLCCGQDIRNGYLNIDVRRLDPRILQLDLEKDLLTPIPPNSVEEVIAQDCIEHISWRRVPDLLRDIYRVLKCNGVFVMHVPDLEEIAKLTFLNPGYDDFLKLSSGFSGGRTTPRTLTRQASPRHLLGDS